MFALCVSSKKCDKALNANQITQLDRGYCDAGDFFEFRKIDFEARFGICAKNAAERSMNWLISM